MISMSINYKKLIVSSIIFLIIFVLCPFSIKSAIRYFMTEKAIREMLTKGNLEDRQYIERIKNGQNYIFPALINLLKDKNKHVQIRAINLLGFVGDKKAIKPLADLLDSNDWEIRFFSVESLGLIGDKEATIQLAERWMREQNWRVLRQIVTALVRLDDERAVFLLNK